MLQPGNGNAQLNLYTLVSRYHQLTSADPVQHDPVEVCTSKSKRTWVNGVVLKLLPNGKYEVGVSGPTGEALVYSQVHLKQLRRPTCHFARSPEWMAKATQVTGYDKSEVQAICISFNCFICEFTYECTSGVAV